MNGSIKGSIDASQQTLTNCDPECNVLDTIRDTLWAFAISFKLSLADLGPGALCSISLRTFYINSLSAYVQYNKYA